MNSAITSWGASASGSGSVDIFDDYKNFKYKDVENAINNVNTNDIKKLVTAIVEKIGTINKKSERYKIINYRKPNDGKKTEKRISVVVRHCI